VKRLGQIVVGPAVQPGDAIRHRIARGQDQDRRGIAPAPQRLQDLQPVHVRQPQIEDNRIVAFGRQDIERALAAIDQIDGKAPGPQRCLHPARKARIVLDDQYPQQPIPLSMRCGIRPRSFCSRAWPRFSDAVPPIRFPEAQTP
jgi:hypothetical protein